jgi:hypothetical protein
MDEDHSLELEREKLALERERLTLDREVFNSDAAKRFAEVEKLLAEKDKQIADKVKTDLESEDMKKKWYKRPAIITSLSLPAVVVGLLTAFLGYMGTHSKQEYEIEVASLSAQKTGLENENKQLKDRGTVLKEQNDEAAKHYGDLVAKQQTLQQNNDALTVQANNLATTAELGNLKDYISLLTKDPPGSLIASNRYIGEIVAEIEDDKNGHKHEFLRESADKTSSKLEIRALLYEALLNSTHDAQYARMIGRLSDNADMGTFTTFGSLLNTDSFDVKDRSKFICSVYKHLGTGSRIPMLRELSFYDRAATVDCRDPFIELIIFYRDSWLAAWAANSSETFGFGSGTDLYEVCPQEGVISTIRASARSEVFLSAANTGGPLMNKIDELVGFGILRLPNDVIAVLPRRSESRGNLTAMRQQWLDANKELVSIWSEGDLATIRGLPNSAFQQILRGKWLSIDELR